ncbi:integrase [Parabacteroides sp. AF48-14]|uniref:site-specific tyrosine recombinase/integron integrase n=1 Tax=Parabacteroides sp. AF48-14 TaxID=2292052 RepID=UPI000EFF7E6B|nr:site-specific tyrosine recombinase/integron integrase [Parabacteroides sp. AF48-14]RHO63365.1 integrase [Parabacteroides sp. AF48-14]
MKEKLISDFRDILYGKIPTENISIILEALSYVLKDYDLTKKETAIVLYDDTDKTIYQKFFVAKAVEGLSPNSLTYYGTILSCFLNKVGKHIKEITTEDVRLYLAYKKIEKSSDNTLNNIRRVMNSFFNWCVEEELIGRNPVSRIKGVRQVKKIRNPLSEDEMEKLRYEAKTKRNKAIIEFLFSTGCRVSEMIGVNREDVNLLDGQIEVLGKGKKYRVVYLSSRCKLALKEYLESRNDDIEALFISDWDGMNGAIASNMKPCRISKSAVESMLRSLGKRVGIKNVHPHRFRRTAATTALKRGMPIEQVQRMLGHESIQTTTIYAQSTNNELKLNHEKYII